MTENELYFADADAFPQTRDEVSSGMTLRDYFAAKALMSMLSPVQDISETTPAIAAKWAYIFADAMMKQRDSIYGFGEENGNV